MKKIPLTNGGFSTVDDVDFALLSKRNWHRNVGGYVVSRNVYMHALVNKTSKGFHTDHINRDKLDNRKKNLRTVTSGRNLLNSKTYVTNTSGCRGVHFYKRHGKWTAYINVSDVRGKRFFLGYFDSKKEAISARKNAEKQFI